MKKNFKVIASLEEKLCEYSSGEGLGSIYERVMVMRFFKKLMKVYSFNSVLEYGNLSITKGLDNLVFLVAGKRVTVSDQKVTKYLKKWPQQKKPVFVNTTKLQGRFNLVWNFGLAQIQPDVIDEMIKKSNKYLLLFVPNFVNCGMPIHLLYHLLTQTKCNHTERGSIKLRSLGGIKKLVKDKGIHIIKAGYIDVPILPDIGFSIRELRQVLNLQSKSKSKPISIDSTKTLKFIDRLDLLEERNISDVIKQFFAHHVYVFGKVT